jgi:hypothetical protein
MLEDRRLVGEERRDRAECVEISPRFLVDLPGLGVAVVVFELADLLDPVALGFGERDVDPVDEEVESFLRRVAGLGPVPRKHRPDLASCLCDRVGVPDEFLVAQCTHMGVGLDDIGVSGGRLLMEVVQDALHGVRCNDALRAQDGPDERRQQRSESLGGGHRRRLLVREHRLQNVVDLADVSARGLDLLLDRLLLLLLIEVRAVGVRLRRSRGPVHRPRAVERRLLTQPPHLAGDGPIPRGPLQPEQAPPHCRDRSLDTLGGLVRFACAAAHAPLPLGGERMRLLPGTGA